MKLTPKVAAQPKWLFPPIERPTCTDTLKFPEDITKLSTQDVSRAHGQYQSLYAFAISQASKADVAVLRARSACMIQRANIARTGHTYGKRKYDIDQLIRVDMKLQVLEQALLEEEIKQTSYKSYVEIFDRYAAALSREITRRTSELQRT